MAKLSRTVSEPVVLLAGAKQKNLKVRTVYRGIGGVQLDYAILHWDTSETRRGDLLHDLDLRQEFVGSVLEIYVDTPKGQRFIHAGQVSEVRPTLSSEDLGLEVVSKIQPYHFGERINGMEVRYASLHGFTIDDEIVFNPELDGQICGNMDSIRSPAGYHFFLDVESSRTTQALKFQRQPADAAKNKLINMWTLAKAAHYLMWTANPEQTFAKNWDKTISDLEQLLKFQPLRNQRLPSGLHLMEALDRLLAPYGWRPFIEYKGQGQRKIQFMRLGDPKQKIVTLSHQRKGQVYDPDKTFVEGLDVRARIDDRLVNDLTVRGDWIYLESTFELYRAWPPEFDTVAIASLSLALGYTEAEIDAFVVQGVLHRRAWRDWVLSEDGSYTGLRPEITKPYDLTRLFGPRYCVRRRKFLPTISVRQDGTPRGDVQGVRVQYQIEAEGTWHDADPAWTIRVLERECGIRFDDAAIIAELYNAGTNAKVRVTATLRSDKRITYRAKAAGSINPFRVPLTLDVPERFAKKLIDENSSYAQEAIAADVIGLIGGPIPLPPVNQAALALATVDDSAKIEAFTKSLVETWNQATVEGPITLPALDWTEYELGNRVRGISLRDVTWQVHHSEQRYPQIVGISYQVPSQQMTLILDTPREDLPPEGAA